MASSVRTWTRRRAVGAAVMALALLAAAPAFAQEAGPPVLPAEAPAPPAARAPEILRGSVAPPPAAVEPAAGPEAPRIVAGDRVWFVDHEAGRLTGCRLINTIRVDIQAIRCTERRLPRGARGEEMRGG